MTGLARYGEKLSAAVGLIAIGMVLVILNWFFHKTYWTGHLARLHGKKQAMLASAGIAFVFSRTTMLAERRATESSRGRSPIDAPGFAGPRSCRVRSASTSIAKRCRRPIPN